MLNIKKINEYLSSTPIKEEIQSAEHIYSGVSSNVYRLHSVDGSSMILKSSLSNGDIVTSYRIKWQHNLQNYLSNYFPAPKPFCYSLNSSIIGTPFYIMQDINGERMYDEHSVKKSFDFMIKLHEIDSEPFTKNKMYAELNTKKFVNRVVAQYKTRRFSDEADKVADWLIKNIPPTEKHSFCHNDWKLSNMVFFDKSLSGVLDWELSSISDPRIDFGIAMSYWPEKNWISPEKDYQYSKNKIIKHYFDRTGFDYSEWKFFEVLGIFRLITIGQIAGHRNKQGMISGRLYEGIYDKIYVAINKCERIIHQQ